MAAEELEFQKIYRSFGPKIFRYLSRLAGEGEAEDLTQEVFIKISTALGTFRGDSQVSTWIYKIATNTALDKLRSASFRSSIADGSASNETSLENDDLLADESAPPVDTSLIKEEMSDCIHQFIDRLPPDYRAVIILSEFEELKNDEIAKVLGITIDTVKIRLHRARARLKKEFESGCDFYHDEQNKLACDQKNPKDPS